MSMKDIRILLVDNHEVVRRGVRSILESEADIEIVGDCSSAEEALVQSDTLSPNIILVDAKIPGMGGIEVTHRLRQKETPAHVVILTLSPDYLAEALAAGVAGYLLEDINSQELVQAIRKVYHGELVVDERLRNILQAGEGSPAHRLLAGGVPDILIREAELIIPPPVAATHLLRFLYHLEESLEATMLEEIGSWDKGTAITILLPNAKPLTIIRDKLAQMPEVENVSEKPAAKYRPFHSAPKIIARPETHPRAELLVTLKPAEPTKP